MIKAHKDLTYECELCHAIMTGRETRKHAAKYHYNSNVSYKQVPDMESEYTKEAKS